jgi:hypothetical protein
MTVRVGPGAMLLPTHRKLTVPIQNIKNNNNNNNKKVLKG